MTNHDQAQPLRDFVVNMQSKDPQQQAREEFDHMTVPIYGEHYRDKRGNITMDVKPSDRETEEGYLKKLARFKGGV